MKRKRVCGVGRPVMRALAVIAAALCVMTGFALAESKVMVVSDPHYMEQSLYRGSDVFLRILRGGDGKITQYSEELMAALYGEVLHEKPDALIVTGDLTFNGEKKSHAALAEWFERIEEAGVDVWVIPGNHDINTASPVGFADGVAYSTEGTSPEDFEEIYGRFLERGEAGFSYIARIGGRLWAAMTDVAWYNGTAQTFGVFTAAHARWLENALDLAAAEGAEVISATHHSLLAHTEFLKDNYVMFGSESMAAVVRSRGVRLNLSGHLHIQHIVREDGFADAALAAFCVWPHRYAIVTLDDEGALKYEAKALSGDFLPEGFSGMSREWFAEITRDKVLSSVPEGSEEEAVQMAEFAVRFNLAYFSGTYQRDDPSWQNDPAFALWEKQGGSGFWQYMKMVMDEAAGDNLHYETGARQ